MKYWTRAHALRLAKRPGAAERLQAAEWSMACPFSCTFSPHYMDFVRGGEVGSGSFGFGLESLLIILTLQDGSARAKRGHACLEKHAAQPEAKPL